MKKVKKVLFHSIKKPQSQKKPSKKPHTQHLLEILKFCGMQCEHKIDKINDLG